MNVYDVAVVGGGVVGAAVARALSRYRLSVVILEKEEDVSFGVSKANSGIVHGGFHHPLTSLKARLEIRGNMMYDRLQEELHFPFRRCGILVAAFTEEEMKTVNLLYEQGTANRSIGIELCNRERMRHLEPKLNPDVVGGLHAPCGGIVEPYRLVFSLVESALKNGVELLTGFEVASSGLSGGQPAGFTGTAPRAAGRDAGDRSMLIRAADGRRVRARFAVNAAGLYADRVSEALGGERFTLVARKGEEYLMDRNAGAYTGKVIFPVPSTVSKGILVIPTVEGTTMVGPTAEEVDDREDVFTSAENFEKVFYFARRLVPSVSERDIITAFSGIRPALPDGDFFIAVSRENPRLVQAAGIQSPGLTAAPAIAEHVRDLLVRAGLELTADPSYDPCIQKVPRLREMSVQEAEEQIRRDRGFAHIVCRCETVSEAEVVEAIRNGHTTLDGIKFYTRAGMGRCQGGFCTYTIMKILERETGVPFDRITKRGRGSRMLLGTMVGGLAPEGARS
jgi:glycerol-3-phosphate dehydrogenase